MTNANRLVTLFFLAMVALVLAPWGVLSAASGQETVVIPRANRYDGHRASRDATNRRGAARLAAVARQLDAWLCFLRATKVFTSNVETRD